MPPSRTSRLEPTPITVTGTSLGLLLQELREIIDIRRLEQHLGRAADPEPGDGGQQPSLRSGGP